MRKVITLLVVTFLLLSCRLFSPPGPVIETSAQTGPDATSEPAALATLTLDGLYAEYAGEVGAAGSIGEYLNAGGAVDHLEAQLTGIQTGSSDEIKAQVIEKDLTGDGCADVLVGLALPSAPGYGDAILAVFTCQGSQYVRHNVFGRVGAGGRGEGLYDGGGANLELVEDLNADDVPEIVFFVASLGELYIAAWNGAEFTSLVERVDELGFPSSYIPAQEGAFEITDVDDDGALEVLLSNPPGLWQWDGTLFQPAPE